MCGTCEHEPCTCRKSLAVVTTRQTVPQKYDFRECTTPGCTVQIGFLTGSVQGLTTCRWCQAGVSHKA